MINSVERQFSRAAHFYDENAVVQSRISDYLFNILSENVELPLSPSVLEIGCGTGNLTGSLMKLNPCRLYLNDICTEYEDILCNKFGRGNFNYLKGDAVEVINELCRGNMMFNLIASSSAIQWLSEPLDFLNSCADLLYSGGVLAVSTFLPDNLFQLRTICNVTAPVIYSSIDDIRVALSDRYEIIFIGSNHEVMMFNSVNDILRHLKYTGVNAANINDDIPMQIWTKSKISRLTADYRDKFYIDNAGYPLTYSPVWILAVKR